MTNLIIDYLEKEHAAAKAELAKHAEAQQDRNAESARRKRSQRCLKGAKRRAQRTRTYPYIPVPDRAAAFRAACRDAVARTLLKERHLLEAGDVNEIRTNIWCRRPALETDLRTRKFEKYLDEYLQHLIIRLTQLRSPPAAPPKAWSENNVRKVLKLRTDLTKLGLKSLQALQMRNEIAAQIYLRDELQVILFERFLFSKHLASSSEFERVAQIYRADIPYLPDVARSIVVALWQSLVDDLVESMRRDFGRPSSFQTVATY